MEKINIKTITQEFGEQQNPNIVILDDMKKLREKNCPTQLLIEGFLFGVILNGNARIIIDNVEYALEKGDMFGCNPRNILEKSMLSMDLEILCIFITPEYVRKLLQTIHVEWSFLMMANTHEILHSSEAELERFVNYMELLRKKLSIPSSKNQEESIILLIQSMGMEVFEIREHQTQQTQNVDYGPGENLVQRFMMMLDESSQNGKPFLNVNRYAEELNVTPKYFSFVCKQKLGKTASEIIRDAILHAACILLRDNSYSIKLIASRLGFANQSHFGTFFHRYTGCSPQKFRTENMT